jgi:hypothetical protein
MSALGFQSLARGLALAAALVATPALADHTARSPESSSFELRLSGYHPSIDAEFKPNTGPYQQTFGSDRGWMARLNMGRTLWRGIGTLEFHLGTGYFEKYGKGTIAGSTLKSNDNTGFKVVPLSVGLTYRFDWAAEELNIPLAPYVRVSLERYNWWITNGSSDIPDINNRQGYGATNGFSGTLGLALLLDFLDPDLAREMDQDTGINHTYLFMDITRSQVNNFGSGKSWDLSDDQATFAGGLLFVF